MLWLSEDPFEDGPPPELGVGRAALLESFTGQVDGGLGSLRDDPFHLAGADFILRDSAGLAGAGFHDRRSAALQLAGTAGSDENVAVIAVEAFNQLHSDSPAA